jgi:hypothetical protein
MINGFDEMLVIIYQTTWWNIPEDRALQLNPVHAFMPYFSTRISLLSNNSKVFTLTFLSIIYFALISPHAPIHTPPTIFSIKPTISTEKITQTIQIWKLLIMYFSPIF